MALVAQLRPATWVPAAQQVFIGKYKTNDWSYALSLNTAGNSYINFQASVDGTSQSVIGNGVLPPFATGETGWLAVSRNATVLKFFYSRDGATWTQLGSDGVLGFPGAVFDSDQILCMGGWELNAANLNGGLLQGQVYNGIPPMLGGTDSATPVVDFNPQRDATTPTGTITSSTTSEVWTINGASSVVRNAAYHGSGIDGVKAFNTDLTGAALPTSYTYDAVSLNGVAGTYVSTTDLAAFPTDDIELRFKLAANDWTPAAESVLLNKYGAAGQRSLIVSINAAGNVRVYLSSDGTASVNNVSSVALNTVFTDAATGYVKVTRTKSDGVVTISTSTDGSTYTQLGTTFVLNAGQGIFDSTAPILLGAETGGTLPWGGKLYQAQIYNGINGTLAVDFDASRYAGGTTLTGSTGETWTLQGNAKIHPTNYPNLGFLSEAAATNLCLQSNAFTTTWSEIGSAAATQNAIGPDGATSAWTLTDNDAGALESKYQAITLTAAVHTVSIFVKKTTGAQASYPAMYITDSVNAIAAAVIDTSNGVATIFTAYTGFANPQGTATCVSYNADYWRVSITFTASAVPWTFLFAPAGTTNPSQSTGSFSTAVTGSAVFYGAQVELGSVATSYIPTTTIAVARNGDIDSLPTAGNILAAAGTIALTYTPTSAPSGTRFLWGTYVDASNYTAILHDATNLIFRKRIAGVNTDATIANAFVSGTTYKMCASWGAAGQTIYLNGTAGTPHANTTAAQIAATMQVGADGNSLQQPAASIKNGFIWNRALSGSEQAAITT
jgi:hypothetical protein